MRTLLSDSGTEGIEPSSAEFKQRKKQIAQQSNGVTGPFIRDINVTSDAIKSINPRTDALSFEFEPHIQSPIPFFTKKSASSPYSLSFVSMRPF